MSPTLILIVGGIGALLLIIIGLYVLIAVQHVQTNKRKQRVDASVNTHQADWYQYLIEGSIVAEDLAPAGKIDMLAADAILYTYRNSFYSEKIHVRIVH